MSKVSVLCWTIVLDNMIIDHHTTRYQNNPQDWSSDDHVEDTGNHWQFMIKIYLHMYICAHSDSSQSYNLYNP